MTNSPTVETAEPQIRNEALINFRTGKPAGVPHAVLLLVILCLPTLAAVLLSPVLPSISAEFAMDPAVDFLVPLIATVPSLMIALLAVPFGSLADRLGRRGMLLIALVSYSIFGTAPLYLDTLPAIVLSRVGVGIAEAAITIAGATLLTDYFFGNRRNRYIGLSSVATSIAAALFLTIGGVLGATSWRTPFWMYTLAVILAIPTALAIWEPKMRQKRSNGEPKPKLPPIPFRFLAFPLVIALFTGMALFAVVVQMPFVYTALGETSIGLIGLYGALGSIGSAIGAIAFRWMAVWGVARLIPGLLLVAGIGLTLAWCIPAIWAAVSGGVITSFATGALLPAVITWTVTRLTLEQRGRGIGRNTSAVYVGSFISPLLIVAIAGILGSVAAAMAVLGVVGILGAFVCVFLLSRSPQASLTHSVV